ncbi:germination protease [Clostridia bacterium]|nr:germination protease [Clostridia bacterium]
MQGIRTDLALETREDLASRGDLTDGILFDETDFAGYKITEIAIMNDTAEEITGRKRGNYITVEFGKIWQAEYDEFVRLTELIAEIIKKLSRIDPHVNRNPAILVAGLGNRFITADAIGPLAVSKILISRHIKEQIPELANHLGGADISGITPGVLGQTGIESADILRSLAAIVKPQLVIIIDSLASRKLSRLATTIQLSDTGISPGSGVGNHRQAINAEFLSVPRVISIGVPTVIDAATLAVDVIGEACRLNGTPMPREYPDIVNGSEAGSFFVTPKESDVIISEAAKVIGFAINRAFYADLPFEEMARLVG